ncbi:MAG: hypothetical protein M1826_000249 [Phylliscum demangeonii]|nr:MAG: hypothetical protein M1826_000249 [Phylliscum demangeonii]
MATGSVSVPVAGLKLGRKRSLFNKPAWSTGQTTGDGVDFFSRSKQSYPEIVKQQDASRQRRQARNRASTSRRDEDEKDDDNGAENGVGGGGGGGDDRAGKRARTSINLDDDEDDSGSEDSEAEAEARRKAEAIALEDSDDEKARPPPPPDDRADTPPPSPAFRRRYETMSERTLPKPLSLPAPAVTPRPSGRPAVPAPAATPLQSGRAAAREPAPIEISDDEAEAEADGPPMLAQPLANRNGNDGLGATPARAAATQAQGAEPDSDEEYPELRAKAHERARLQRAASSSEGPLRSSPSSEQPYNKNKNRTSSRPSSTIPAPPPPAPLADAKVNIFISSWIPNTKPLIIKRLESQNLREVRTTWCARQGFDSETTRSVFFTWRNKRLFDVTTCKSLGGGAGGGGVTASLFPGDEKLAQEDRRVDVEATTEAIFEAGRRARANGGPSPLRAPTDAPPVGGQDATTATTAAPVPEEQIRVILKAKGYEDFKLIVKPTTIISRMQQAFRQARKVESTRDVFLMFDGEKLDPDRTVVQTDISDLDHIDVHVR